MEFITFAGVMFLMVTGQVAMWQFGLGGLTALADFTLPIENGTVHVNKSTAVLSSEASPAPKVHVPAVDTPMIVENGKLVPMDQEMLEFHLKQKAERARREHEANKPWLIKISEYTSEKWGQLVSRGIPFEAGDGTYFVPLWGFVFGATSTGILIAVIYFFIYGSVIGSCLRYFQCCGCKYSDKLTGFDKFAHDAGSWTGLFTLTALCFGSGLCAWLSCSFKPVERVTHNAAWVLNVGSIAWDLTKSIFTWEYSKTQFWGFAGTLGLSAAFWRRFGIEMFFSCIECRKFKCRKVDPQEKLRAELQQSISTAPNLKRANWVLDRRISNRPFNSFARTLSINSNIKHTEASKAGNKTLVSRPTFIKPEAAQQKPVRRTLSAVEAADLYAPAANRKPTASALNTVD